MGQHRRSSLSTSLPSRRARAFVLLTSIASIGFAAAMVGAGVQLQLLSGVGFVVGLGSSFAAQGWGTTRPIGNRSAIESAGRALGWSQSEARWLYRAQLAVVFFGVLGFVVGLLLTE